eukprot:SAG31_NODE_2597_length_5420_cov_16.255403_7_plen_110_part_00
MQVVVDEKPTQSAVILQRVPLCTSVSLSEMSSEREREMARWMCREKTPTVRMVKSTKFLGSGAQRMNRSRAKPDSRDEQEASTKEGCPCHCCIDEADAPMARRLHGPFE